jgi:hypothetical protein
MILITLFVNIKAWWHFEFFQLPVKASEVRIVVSPLSLFCIFRTMWEASHSKQYHIYKWNIFVYCDWLMALVNLHMINSVLQVCVCARMRAGVCVLCRAHACVWMMYILFHWQLHVLHVLTEKFSVVIMLASCVNVQPSFIMLSMLPTC